MKTKSKAWKMMFSMLLILILVMDVSTIPASASTVFARVDNDTANTSFRNYMHGTWDYENWFGSYGNYYFNNERFGGDDVLSNGQRDPDDYYSWTSYSSYVNELTELNVYLYDNRTLGYADYYVLDSSGTFKWVGGTNQNNAIRGWNPIFSGALPVNKYFDIIVKPNPDIVTGGYYTVGDCIEAYYTD